MKKNKILNLSSNISLIAVSVVINFMNPLTSNAENINYNGSNSENIFINEATGEQGSTTVYKSLYSSLDKTNNTTIVNGNSASSQAING